MSDQSVPLQAPPAALPMPTDPEAIALAGLYELLGQWVTKAKTVNVPQEADDWGKGILALAQAAAVIDPQRLVGGDHPESRLAAAPKVPVRDSDGDGQIGES